MRVRLIRALILAMVLVLSAAAAAIADSADQTVEIDVQPKDALGITVQEDVYLVAEVGQQGDWQGFDMNILNTTSAGWQVSATSTDLVGSLGQVIPASALEIWGQDQTDYDDGWIIGMPPYILDNSTPLVILQGTPDLQGWFPIQQKRTALRLITPDDDALVGQVHGTVTYTIVTHTP